MWLVFYGAGFDQLGIQAIAVGSTIAYSAIVTLILAVAGKYTLGMRVDESVETEGIDLIHSA